MIPKNIIYVWFGKSEYPKSVSDYIKNWKKSIRILTLLKLMNLILILIFAILLK